MQNKQGTIASLLSERLNPKLINTLDSDFDDDEETETGHNHIVRIKVVQPPWKAVWECFVYKTSNHYMVC